MIGKKSLTPFVFDFLRHGERKEVMTVGIKRRSIGILCCILNECFDNNEISLNLVRYGQLTVGIICEKIPSNIM